MTGAGADGADAAAVPETADDEGEVPAMFVAVTEIEYVEPMVSPTNVQLVFETGVGAHVIEPLTPAAVTV